MKLLENMKKLYYTVHQGFDSSDKLDGSKHSQVYSIENNELKFLCNVHMTLYVNHENHVRKHIETNGLCNEKFELILL